ncbi:hypothetical protein Pla110_44510 [Polystyrenella longa]|uniref:Uncharacterized protein n=1 Tax=Polystyrenella longa TaxID=2528007 RepID=A0A518CTX7_9PLAN|nr:hypothetical protein [Polystyrenella longa]QDU82690.1 hypothetical protein Pla110_44510 [Polystyrenella longa]
MKFITLLPKAYNDGSEVSPQTVEEIVEAVSFQFGGCTVAGDAKGAWVHEGNLYRDETIVLICHCDNSRYTEARDAVIAIGRKLNQLEMYFEVQDFDGAENLKVE